MQIGQMLGRVALAVTIALVTASAGWGQGTDGSARRVALLAAIEGPIGPAGPTAPTGPDGSWCWLKSDIVSEPFLTSPLVMAPAAIVNPVLISS